MNLEKIFEKHKVYKFDNTEFSNADELLSLPNVKGVSNPKLAVFYIDESENQLNDKLFLFLSNILKAVNIDIENVILVNVAKPINASKVCSVFSLNKAILFGVSLNNVSLQINAHNYQLVLLNKVSYLFAESLTSIEAEKAKKIELWNALKVFFEIE